MDAQSYEKPKPPQPEIRVVSGNVPGVLDPTQPSRLLRLPGSKLTFASFDPYIATPNELNVDNLSMNDRPECRPKRIVIETIPDGRSFWRWVPSARKQEDVNDEGSFPRLVDICGALCEITQDQWDIYKLDPKYDCFVKFNPAFTVISIKECPTFNRPASSGSIPPRDSTESSSFSTTGSNTTERDPDQMIVDDDNTPFNPLPTRPLPRRKRRASPRTPHHFDFSASQTQTETSTAESSKRPRGQSFQSLRPTDEEENNHFEEDLAHRNTKFYTPRVQKRSRTLSPRTKHRTLNALKSERKNAKQTRWDEAKQERRAREEDRFLRELYSEVPPAFANNNNYSNFTDVPEEDEASMADGSTPTMPEPTPGDDEDSEERRLAESKRKIAELNSDRRRQRDRELREGKDEVRPQRARTEGFDEEKTDADREEARKKEEARKRKEAREREEARQREEARLWRKHQEELERIRLKEEEENRVRQEYLRKLDSERETRHAHWNYHTWTHARAIERYRATCDFFDKTKSFSAQAFPLYNIDIPWPTLRHPMRNSPRDMDWASVAEFFEVAKQYVRGNNPTYKSFLRTSQIRFHPDKWQKVYDAILEEQLRDEVKTAINTVSQAINALVAAEKAKSA